MSLAKKCDKCENVVDLAQTITLEVHLPVPNAESKNPHSLGWSEIDICLRCASECTLENIIRDACLESEELLDAMA